CPREITQTRTVPQHAEQLQCRVFVTLKRIRKAEFCSCAGASAREADRFLQFRNRLGVPAPHHVDLSEPEMRMSEIWIHFQRSPDLFVAFVIASSARRTNPQI